MAKHVKRTHKRTATIAAGLLAAGLALTAAAGGGQVQWGNPGFWGGIEVPGEPGNPPVPGEPRNGDTGAPRNGQ